MLLITGASGFVGRHLIHWLHDSDRMGEGQFEHGILPLYWTSPLPNGLVANLSDLGSIRNIFRSYEVTGIIHLAAESRTGVCQNNPAAAYAGNVLSTMNLLESARETGVKPWFLYVSTDMVFSGRKGGYDEESGVSPINEYGKSKVAAEDLVRLYENDWCILRPALIYGNTIGGRGSSFAWTLDALRSGRGCFYEDEIRTPVFVHDLVRLIDLLWKSRHRGILHGGGLDRVSRVDFAAHVAELWGLEKGNIRSGRLADSLENDWRPRDLSLISDHAYQIMPFTPLRTALRQMKMTGVHA